MWTIAGFAIFFAVLILLAFTTQWVILTLSAPVAGKMIQPATLTPDLGGSNSTTTRRLPQRGQRRRAF